ncbi:hypothetical protein AU210_015866 [Fusarium oxysporum f. sp. radicis-cucumerinum]|uniref:Glucosidase 2 subunit beta n=1 Tax=Fusarium oxysporum f. sp. radicis-cucumerinum TaxID=327505 RepID=A0A2H3FU56_FUSOX|nr:hypothetical protein AU210_015866 [Fusarium oxysporum f. sp. radicis-cucumerinum]
MQHPSSAALLSAIFAFTLAAAGSLPKGVGPEFASHYKGKEKFFCITNAAIKLSLSQINDNSCDCPDGSDEPGTAACALLDPLSPEQPLSGSVSGTTNVTNALPGFWCANEGHIEEYKGVGGVKCENRCGEIGKEYRRLEEEKRRAMGKAETKRKAMAGEARDLRQRVETKVAELKGEIAALETKKEDLTRKHRKVEQEEKGKVARGGGTGGKLGVLVGLAKARVHELRQILEDVVGQRDELQERVSELEELLTKFKKGYNPNFNDEGVKAAVKSFEDYSAREETGRASKKVVNEDDILSVLQEDSERNGVNWKEFEEGDASVTDIIYNFEAYLPPFARSLLHSTLNFLRIWLITDGILADNPIPGQESTLVRAVRAALEVADRDLTKKTKDLAKEEQDLAQDYGPDDIFRALKNKCISLEAGEYTYEHCWLEKAMQKSKKGHGHSIMGHFKRIQRDFVDDEDRLDGKSLGRGERIVLRYEDGQQCWNGPKRRTDVWLGCSETEEVWRVSEAEKCVYKMVVGTPAACEFAEAAGVRKKDEL